LLALLAATGLRISEALNLRFADITADGLLVRETKFQKTRLVPLHDTAVAGLHRYVTRRRLIGAGDDHVFIDRHGRALQYQLVYSTFQTLLKKAGLLQAPSGRRPHLHDLRHAFAVKALQACPAGRSRISEHMVALATYLGHVNIYATYWYLEATSELLRDSADCRSWRILSVRGRAVMNRSHSTLKPSSVRILHTSEVPAPTPAILTLIASSCYSSSPQQDIRLPHLPWYWSLRVRDLPGTSVHAARLKVCILLVS
jgi:hypothetical protein